MEKITGKQIVAVVGLIAIAVISVVSLNKTEKKIEEIETNKTNIETFKDGFVYEEFMKGCVEVDIELFKKCDCVATNVYENVGIDGFIKAADYYDQTNELNSVMMTAVNSCI